MAKGHKKLTKLEKYLSKKILTKRKDTAGVVGLSIGDLIYDMARIDPMYIRGAQFAKPKTDLNSILKIGRQNLKDISEKGQSYFDRLHDVNYTGGVHEFVTDQYMLKTLGGVEIEIPKNMNQEGWDRIYNGQKWQIKFGSVDNVREAREKAEYPVATDIETAALYREKYPEDAFFVLGTTPRSLTENIIADSSAASMEIYEDDVKCSHGSTTGQIDEDSLFYLQSRGISRTDAIQFMVKGFANEVVEKCNDETFSKIVSQSIELDTNSATYIKYNLSQTVIM